MAFAVGVLAACLSLCVLLLPHTSVAAVFAAACVVCCCLCCCVTLWTWIV